MELFKELGKTYMQAIVSVAFLFAGVDVITWILLAFWGIKVAIHFLRKDAESRCPW